MRGRVGEAEGGRGHLPPRWTLRAAHGGPWAVAMGSRYGQSLWQSICASSRACASRSALHCVSGTVMPGDRCLEGSRPHRRAAAGAKRGPAAVFVRRGRNISSLKGRMRCVPVAGALVRDTGTGCVEGRAPEARRPAAARVRAVFLVPEIPPIRCGPRSRLSNALIGKFRRKRFLKLPRRGVPAGLDERRLDRRQLDGRRSNGRRGTCGATKARH